VNGRQRPERRQGRQKTSPHHPLPLLPFLPLLPPLPPVGSFSCVLCLVALFACASPESQRVRGGSPGADVGNRGAAVEMHAGAEPYHETPCVTTRPRCDGPEPMFGPE
jgi:hypothetical protein